MILLSSELKPFFVPLTLLVCSRKYDGEYLCHLGYKERNEPSINFDLFVNEQAGKITMGNPPARAAADRREE